ncbi:phosphate regulon transcriptional regulatory protein phob (sphr) [hydrocarbon metagenome]|uniref:Phosphate regulon transcriptional regulatory protein phob (Sphr) n=1 Tax=hydrocarbon metagenome TaxID=938273 RepID=A0A0W8E8G2_9ZZZZ
MKRKILVVDDEESLVRLITYNLNKEGFNTVYAYDGGGVTNIIEKEKPDLLILDLMLPEKGGLEVCQEIRSSGSRIPIIMLTARDEELDRVLGLELGADDYVTKPFSVRELVARVKAVLRRNLGQETEDDKKRAAFRAGPFTVKPESYEIYFNDTLLDLTLKEYELLDILIRNRGRVLKRDYLLELLWEYSESVNTRVLDVHISKLRDKVETDSKNPQYIKTVRGLGYKLEAD